MGGDGQALMNNRKHLLSFISGTKRQTREEAEAEAATVVDANTNGWSLCSNSGEQLTLASSNSVASSDSSSATSSSYALTDVVVDFLGNLYLREKVLATLIERAKVAKMGGVAIPSTAEGGLGASTSSGINTVAAIHAHNNSIRNLTHISKFGKDFVELSKENYNMNTSGGNSGAAAAADEATLLKQLTDKPLGLTCLLSGVSSGTVGNTAAVGSSSSSIPTAGGSVSSASSSAFVCLWECGHCFTSKALLAHWERVVRVASASVVNTSEGGGEAAEGGIPLCCPHCDKVVVKLMNNTQWLEVMQLSKQQNGLAWFEHTSLTTVLKEKGSNVVKRRRLIVPLVQPLRTQMPWV